MRTWLKKHEHGNGADYLKKLLSLTPALYLKNEKLKTTINQPINQSIKAGANNIGDILESLK